MRGSPTMLKILIKARFLALFDSVSQIGNRQKKKKASAFKVALAMIALAALVVGSVGVMFWGFCEAFVAVGAPWAFWVLSVIYASMLCIIGSVFAVKTQIFESKDNELLLSMPIPVKYIFLSRMAILLLVNYALQSIILFPCLVVYAIQVGLGLVEVLCFLGVFLLFPLLMLTLSTLIAWLISEISARVKHKTVVTVALFLAFFGAYMYFSMSIGALIGSDSALFDPSGLKNTLVFWWGGNAIASGSGLSLLWFALSSVIPAAVTFVILDKAFIRIITTKKSAARVEYKGNRVKSSKISITLLKKELLRFVTSPNYLLNAGLGCIMALIAAVALAVTSGDLLPILEIEGLEWLGKLIPMAVLTICAFIGSTSYISAPSISLEDRQMWILKSCPIDPRSILMAKLNTHVLICAPFMLVSALILCIAYGVGVWMSLFVVLAVLTVVTMQAYVGLFFGLKFPKLGWQNENAVIKQSAAYMLSSLGTMVLSIGFGVLGYFTGRISALLSVSVIFAISLILCAIIHVYLMGYGVKEYENLKK